jgi:uncharacterized membrane protein YqjE
MATDPQNDRQADPRSVGELVIDVSEKTSTLVREEIELAKAEISEKLTRLVRGGVVGIAAGVFLLLFLAMLMHAIAWLLNDLFFEDSVWLGFLVEALFWLLVAGLAGLVAYRSIQSGGATDARHGDRGGAADQGDPRGQAVSGAVRVPDP